jgi:hypothetical protein
MVLLDKDKTSEEAKNTSKKAEKTSAEVRKGRGKRKGKVGGEGAITPSPLGCRKLKGKGRFSSGGERRERGSCLGDFSKCTL